MLKAHNVRIDVISYYQAQKCSPFFEFYRHDYLIGLQFYCVKAYLSVYLYLHYSICNCRTNSSNTNGGEVFTKLMENCNSFAYSVRMKMKQKCQ